MSTFRRNMLSPPSTWSVSGEEYVSLYRLPWKRAVRPEYIKHTSTWKQHVPPKRRYPPTGLIQCHNAEHHNLQNHRRYNLRMYNQHLPDWRFLWLRKYIKARRVSFHNLQNRLIDDSRLNIPNKWQTFLNKTRNRNIRRLVKAGHFKSVWEKQVLRPTVNNDTFSHHQPS
jgi:hypothetical protein